MNKLHDPDMTWYNNQEPAINETNLNKLEKSVDDIDNRVIEIADLIVVVVPQVQALLDDAEQLVEDCEEHAEDSEAWAVGTRNGVPVPSDDPTYHNNSKWHSEHLQTNLANLNDVEITDVQDGDAIIYDAARQKYVNGTADVGLFIRNGILMCRYEV